MRESARWRATLFRVEQINTLGIYLLGKWMDSTFLHARRPMKENIGGWQAGRAILAIFIEGDVKPKLNESAPAARRLLNEFDRALTDFAADEGFVLPDDRVQQFNAAWGQFESAVQLDLSRQPIYYVTQKGIYATYDLVNGAQFAFAEQVFNAISEEARIDMNQAGRCLAFGIWSGCGFHALRATEKVLREYYEAVTKRPAGKMTMAPLIDKLREAGGDAKTLAVLDQLRDLHRNPMNHPEVFLDDAEAMELFNICLAAISACARQTLKARSTAGTKSQNGPELR